MIYMHHMMHTSARLRCLSNHVMSSDHSEQMSQRSQVSRMALRRGSQNVFVFVIVFVFVFVFVFVNFFGHVMSSHHAYIKDIVGY